MTVPNALCTIGVYGFSADTFIEALKVQSVDLLVDVRQRRAVRGARYAFANASRLDISLAAAGIDVQVWKDFAPTTEIRNLQRDADTLAKTTKSVRIGLAPGFADAYRREILDAHDPEKVLARLSGHARPALLCVERSATACHRHLLAAWLAEASGVDIVDIEP